MTLECTGSLLTSEVKRLRARLVLGSGTAWEYLRVLSAFCPQPLPQAGSLAERLDCGGWGAACLVGCLLSWSLEDVVCKKNESHKLHFCLILRLPRKRCKTHGLARVFHTSALRRNDFVRSVASRAGGSFRTLGRGAAQTKRARSRDAATPRARAAALASCRSTSRARCGPTLSQGVSCAPRVRS